MKKLLVSLAMVIFMVVGCGGGGDSSSGTGGPPVVGTPPTINSHQLYQVDKECAEQYGDDLIAVYDNCSTPIEGQDVYDFALEDLVLFKVETRDPDLDLDYATLEQYLKEGDVYNLYYGPTTHGLPAQNNEIETYLTSLGIDGPIGEWRADFWVTDEQANDSNVLSTYATVHEKTFTIEALLYDPNVGIISPPGRTIVQGGESLTVRMSSRYGYVPWFVDIYRGIWSQGGAVRIECIDCPSSWEYTFDNVWDDYSIRVGFGIYPCGWSHCP